MVSKRTLTKLKKLGDNEVCSKCLKLCKDDEEYSTCCGEIVIKASELLSAIRGKIPKIKLSSRKNIPKKSTPRSSKIDAVSGLRLNTNKYRVYMLWRKGKSLQHIVDKLGINSSSVRSWMGTFKRRFGS
jgi:hypothetical protein